jgi:hypothetical protein
MIYVRNTKKKMDLDVGAKKMFCLYKNKTKPNSKTK